VNYYEDEDLSLMVGEEWVCPRCWGRNVWWVGACRCGLRNVLTGEQIREREREVMGELRKAWDREYGAGVPAEGRK
jgi:hypothetical protein